MFCSLCYEKKNTKEHTDCNPRAVEAICNHHSMDEFIDSSDTVAEAISLQAKNIHKNGGLDLTGFTSNGVIHVIDGNSSLKVNSK